MDLSRNILRGFTATLAARAVAALSSGILMLVLARYLLGPDEYGTLYWAIGILSVTQLFADLGLGKSASRYLAEYSETDPGQLPHILRTVVACKLVVVGAAGSILLVAHEPLAELLGTPALAPFLAAGAVYVAVNSFRNFSRVAFQGLNRLVYSAAVQALAAVSRLVFAVGFALVGLGAIGAFYGFVVGYGIAAAAGGTVLYLQFYRQYDESRREPGLVRRMLEYSVPLTATQGANVLDKRIDIVLVGILLNPVAVAYYTLAKQISDFALTPAGSLGFTISPTFGEQKAADDLAETRALYESSVTGMLLVYLPAAAGLALVAEPFVRVVFGADYLRVVPVLQLFCAYIVLQTVVSLSTHGLDYLGRARIRAIAKGGTAVGNFGLNLVLIPTMGVVGAALATVVTHAIYTAVTSAVIHAELSLRLGRLARRLALIAGITAVMAVTVSLAVPLVTDLVTLIVVIGTGVFTWALLTLTSGFVDLDVVRSSL